LLNIEKNILDTLLKLYQKWLKFDIVSSWYSKNFEKILKKHDIDHIFNEILWWDKHKSKKEKFKYLLEKYNKKVENFLFVTDTLWDILEANELGLKTIAVDFWFHEKERLEKWKPFKIISDFKELEEVLA
jgi:phosphoglycolate phosphatase-like HAD superfamily hydrolase